LTGVQEKVKVIQVRLPELLLLDLDEPLDATWMKPTLVFFVLVCLHLSLKWDVGHWTPLNSQSL
jgi:hypothetical protein